MFNVGDKVVTRSGINGEVVAITTEKEYPVEVKLEGSSDTDLYTKTGRLLCDRVDHELDIRLVEAAVIEE